MMALIAFRFDSPARDSAGGAAAAAPALPVDLAPRRSPSPGRLRAEGLGGRGSAAILAWGCPCHPGNVLPVACSWSICGERLRRALSLVPGDAQPGTAQPSWGAAAAQVGAAGAALLRRPHQRSSAIAVFGVGGDVRGLCSIRAGDMVEGP